MRAMSAMALKPSSRSSDLVAMAVRFQAWWQGCDPRDLLPYKAPADETNRSDRHRADEIAAMAAEAPAGAPPPPPPANPWSKSRIDLVERLWGEGFHTPGGADHILELVKPMRLDETRTLLEIGCGLGGGARTVTTKFGTWVTGIEWWGDLAMAGVERSTRANLVKKAAIQFQANGRLILKPNSFASIFSKEALFTVLAKEQLLQVATIALRLDGELCFTDYVVAGDRRSSPHMETWSEREPIGAHPWSVAEYTSALGQLGFDIRVTENMTERHCQLIREGWRRLVEGREPGSLTPEQMPLVVREAEIWGRREALLRKGDLQLYRFFAIKRQENGRLVPLAKEPAVDNMAA